MASNPNKKPRIEYKDTILPLFLEQKRCDVTFACKNEKGKWKKIGAHKFILIAVSDVFETMMEGEAVKKGAVKKENVIKIDDINIKTFELFLGYIYGADVIFHDVDSIEEFYAAAHKYNVKKAVDFAKDVMIEKMNPKNSINLFEIAVLYDNPDLKEACLKMIVDETTAVLQSSEFLIANPETVKFIFQLNKAVVISEIEFVWALERYINFNKENDPEIAVKVRPALNCIRFLTLSPTDISRTSLLTQEEKKSVIESLPPNKNFSKMPAAFSVRCTERAVGMILSNASKRMIVLLTGVYKVGRYCCICQQYSNRIILMSTHNFWDCMNCPADLTKIYKKYNHVHLVLYSNDDVKIVYDLCKSIGLVK